MSRLCHVRFTPQDLSGYTFDWFKTMPSVIAEEVSKQGVLHYHIAIKTDMCEKSLRNNIITQFRIPKTTRGKGNLHYMLNMDWKDIDYIFKDGKILHNSYCGEDAEALHIDLGNAKYNKSAKSAESSENPQIITQIIEKTDQVWIGLLDKFLDIPDGDQLSIGYIKKLIICHYVNKGKAFPRGADLLRYSYGIYVRLRTDKLPDEITPADLDKLFPNGCEFF